MLSTERSSEGDRVGFKGERYKTTILDRRAFRDEHDDYLAFLEPRLRHARRILASNGSMYVHLDYREVHYVKILIDEVFGRDCFMNEIIWAYDYGGRDQHIKLGTLVPQHGGRKSGLQSNTYWFTMSRAMRTVFQPYAATPQDLRDRAKLLIK